MEQMITAIRDMTKVLESIDNKLNVINDKIYAVDNNLQGAFDSLRGLGLNNSISDLYQILCSIGYEITEIKQKS